MYYTLTEAENVMKNSGVYEWFENFDEDEMQEVYEWMWNSDKTPEQAAKHFGVE